MNSLENSWSRFGSLVFSSRTFAVGVSSLTLLVSACDGESGKDPGTDSSTQIGFLTFNTALIAQTEHIDERFDAIATDLPKTDADVVCLQELWQVEQLENFATRLEDTYPYAHWSAKPIETVEGCEAAETEVLIGCLDDACGDVTADQMTICAVANCANAFTLVSEGCQNCVLNHQTLPPKEIATACNSPDGTVGSYQDQTGLLLLSKYPLESKNYLAMDSSFGDRGVLSARIASAVLPLADVYCTHLVATQSDITYPGVYGSWNGERAVQIDEMATWIEETRSDDGSVVVMGDMNCGPEGRSVAGEDAEGFAHLVETGISAEYVEKNEFTCTFCADNPLVPDRNASVMIDHVLYSALPKNVDPITTRVFDDAITIDSGTDTVETFRSDHYGLLSRLFLKQR